MRWTIGKVHEAGWECLSESTRLLPKIYPEFDYVICYNNLSIEETMKLVEFGIPLHEQTKEQISIPYLESSDVSNHFWKLCPTRLRKESHEIWIDNDIIIRERIPEIDQFLNSNSPIISRTWGEQQYGRFDDMIEKEEWSSCAGFFGLPPHFDLEKRALEICQGMPLQGFDEQGMITYIVSEEENWIPVNSWHIHQEGWWKPVKKIPPGTHFIRLNTGTNSAWETHKLFTHPEPKMTNVKKWMYRRSDEIKKGTISQRSFIVP